MTGTVFLALAHARRTWSIDTPNLTAISLTGLSTGPPGRWVTGLNLQVVDI